MKLFRLITLITLMISSIILAVVVPYHVSEWESQAILIMGMVAGGLGMLLIILTEYVFPNGLYMRLSLTDKTARQIRIL